MGEYIKSMIRLNMTAYILTEKFSFVLFQILSYLHMYFLLSPVSCLMFKLALEEAEFSSKDKSNR